MNRKFNALLLAVAVIVLVALQGGIVSAQTGSGVYSGSNAFHSPVPGDAAYTFEGRLGTFRQGMTEWASPVYRVPAGVDVPLVTITNTYSGRVEQWPIPTYAVPAVAEDGHLAVMHYGTGMVYELYAAVWLSPTTMQAGGMVAYPLNGNGVTDRPNRRVTASGVANTNGMVITEDFLSAAGQLDPNRTINHALSLHIPSWMIDPNGFVAPAVGSESSGTDVSGNGVPMGARFALPRNLNVDALNVHPFTRELLRAARDFGLFVTDATGTPALSNGQAIGTIEVEPGLLQQLYGVDGNDLIGVIQDEVAAVIQANGIYRVTVGGGAPQPPAEVPTQAPVPTIVPTVIVLPQPEVPAQPPVVAPPAEVPPAAPPVEVPPAQPPIQQPPASAPGLSTAGSYGFTAATVVAVGSTIPVDLVVNNPVAMYGFVVDCWLSSDDVLVGSDVAAGALFSDPQVGEYNFDHTDYVYYEVTQSSPVNATGTVLTVTLEAANAGTATITCENYAIDGGGAWIYVPFTPLAITVQ